MKKILFLVLSIPVFAFSQKVAKPDAYAKTITAGDLKKHLYIVAGAEMQGREAATEGERKAAAYIENEFKRIGLQPGNNGNYRQYFNIYQDSLLNANFEVNGQKFLLDKDFNANLNNIPAMFAFSEVLFIGPNVTNDSLKNADLAGRLLLTSGNVQGRTEIIRNKGAAGVMTLSSNYPRINSASRLANLTMQLFKKKGRASAIYRV
jgi:hypothetical protein